MIELRMKDFEEINNTEENNRICYHLYRVDRLDDKDKRYIDSHYLGLDLPHIKLGDEKLYLSNIPRIKIAGHCIAPDGEDEYLYYVNKSNIDYIISAQGISRKDEVGKDNIVKVEKNTTHIVKTFIVEFEMYKSQIRIKSIEIGLKTTYWLLNSYILPSKELFKKVITKNLISYIKELPFTENECEWYEVKIQEYINRHENGIDKIVSLSGGFKIDEDEMPVTETFVPQEKNLTLKGNKLNFPLEFKGKIYQTLKEICKDYGIKYSTAWGRINEHGLSLEEAIFTEVTPRNKKIDKSKGTYNSIGITYKGKYYPSISQLAEEYGIARATLANRIKNGWSIDRAINEPPQPVGRNLSRKGI